MVAIAANLFACKSVQLKPSQSEDKAEAASAPEDKDAGAPTAMQAPSLCPSDMVEVEGDYCTDLQTVCIYNTEINGKRKPGPASLTWACGEYQKPTVCVGSTVHMHYCIDRYEWPNKEGQKPQDWMTWYDAKKAVESVDKRLCTHREWALAAEGPNRDPLPYGNGYTRDSSLCNFDRDQSLNVAMQSKTKDDAASEKLRGVLVPSGSMPDCASAYGVHDMAGNIDEWVVNEASNILECPPDVRKVKKCGELSYRSGLMGGHVWHVRNASRPMTTAHNASFGWYETGTRACKDIQ